MANQSDASPETIRLAPFNPISDQAQEIVLDLLGLESNDVLFDLGCGDGRFLVAAARRTSGLCCVGIELDPVYATRAAQSVQAAEVEVRERIDIRQGDAMDSQMQDPGDGRLSFQDDATAVFLFLVPKGLQALGPLLRGIMEERTRARRSFRIVTYMFSLRGWEPSRVERTKRGQCPVYLYSTSQSVKE
jgi:SAM-dependent methyltransferase